MDLNECDRECKMTKSDQELQPGGDREGEAATGVAQSSQSSKARSCPCSLCSNQRGLQNGLNIENSAVVPVNNSSECESFTEATATSNSLPVGNDRPESLPPPLERSSHVANGDDYQRRSTCLHTCNCRAGPTSTSQSQHPVVPLNGGFYYDTSEHRETGPWCASSTGFPTFEAPSNDMEGYFNANAHVLQGTEENRSSQGPDGGGPQCVDDSDPNRTLTSEDGNGFDLPLVNANMQTNNDIDSNKSDSLHEEGFFEMQHCLQSQLDMPVPRDGLQLQDDSFEDGDFIEPDIPRNAFSYTSSGSNSRNSTTSSYEDLPTITTECDLHRVIGGKALGMESANANLSYGLGSCPSCCGGGSNVDPKGSGCSSRPATLNTRPSGADEGCSSQRSSESSYKTTSSSFQSPQLSDGSVFCGCTPDSSSFPSHEDFLDSDLGSTWSRHTSHSSASNMPSAEVSCCANANGEQHHHACHMCLSHNHADLLHMPHGSHYPNVSGTSTAGGHGERCNLGLCASAVHSDGDSDRDGDVKANNCDSLETAASGLVPTARQSDPNQLGELGVSAECHGGACSMMDNDPFCDDLLDDGHWSDSNIASAAMDTRERSGLLNVSRQTSTSNFDQDENSFQEDIDDRELCQVCQKQLALSEDEDQGEKLTNHDCNAEGEGRSPSPGTESTSSGRLRRSRSAPGDVRRPGSLSSICMEFAQARRQHNTLPGRLRVYGSAKSGTCSHHGNPDSHQMSVSAFSIFIQNYILPKIQFNCVETTTDGTATNQVERVMVWSEYEAYVLQVAQVDSSACGATAVINVLKALEISVSVDDVCDVIRTNVRAETAPLPEYLLSRSVAGATAEYLLAGVEAVTGGAIYGRFFPFYPRRDIVLRQWLAYWMRRGAVPLATLNYQCGVQRGLPIPDAWHHQMIYGVGPRGIYLTNPQDTVPESLVAKQLCSASVLLVRRQDVVSRWTDGGPADLSILIQQQDPRWRTMNVLGQVVNVLREERTARLPGTRPQLTSHIRIPAAYRAGITLFIKRSSPACQELQNCADVTLSETWNVNPRPRETFRGREKRDPDSSDGPTPPHPPPPND